MLEKALSLYRSPGVPTGILDPGIGAPSNRDIVGDYQNSERFQTWQKAVQEKARKAGLDWSEVLGASAAAALVFAPAMFEIIGTITNYLRSAAEL